ncbi:MAG TPA: hypothetical protein VJC05_00265 [Candidatus Andersenbacteria bacterium]|nr:hypothetical protein [Candidatus Andersenbacteria bacterium]
MADLHPRVLSQVFGVFLNKNFAVERTRSSPVERYCLMKNGVDLTGWLKRGEMRDLLQDAVHASGTEAIAKILPRSL